MVIYTVNPMETLLGKNRSCSMTAFSGVYDNESDDYN